MVIDSYSPLLSQPIVRAGSSRTSVDNLQRETLPIFCHKVLIPPTLLRFQLKIHIHLEHNIEHSSTVACFELYTFTKCVTPASKLSLHPLLFTPFSIHFSRRITLPLISTTPTHPGVMSGHQGLSSLHASLEQSGSIMHTVNTAPLFLLLGK